MRRREVVAFLATAAASPRVALAQERPKVARIGFLGLLPLPISRRVWTRYEPGCGSSATSRART